MTLARLLVLLKIYILLECVQVLVEVSPDLHLRCEEVELVWLIHLDVLVELVYSVDCLPDQ